MCDNVVRHERSHPARGVRVDLAEPTIVFLTVCTKDRMPWLAQDDVHAALRNLWQNEEGWLVGRYVLMPDHVHLFCAPHDLRYDLRHWVSWWKRKMSCLHLSSAGLWQRDFWDRRLRRSESYGEKWMYVRENPVRKGLVVRSDDWPYQGIVHELRW